MRFSALGDSAIVAELTGGISPESLDKIRRFTSAVRDAKLAGVSDVVPAFETVTVFYDPTRVAAVDELPYAHLLRELTALAAVADNALLPPEPGREIVIPVCYGGEQGPDISAVARHTGLTVDAVIALHSAASYLVHAIGFSPGFPYLGGLPEKLECPRLATPRLAVPAGSVGIGGAQTGIYPLATPGGWQLIGRTPVRLFDVSQNPPALLQPGDRVSFRVIGPEEFARGLPDSTLGPAEKIESRRP